MKALSLRQPWAWLVAAGLKPIENRRWQTHYRGPLLIHAARTPDDRFVKLFARQLAAIEVPADLPRGGIVGRVDLVDVVTVSDSDWFVGPYGFVVTGAKPLPFLPWRGMPGLFEVPDAALPREATEA